MPLGVIWDYFQVARYLPGIGGKGIDSHVHSHEILSAPTRTRSGSNCSDGSNSRPQLFMEPFVSGFTRESRVPRHEKRKGPDLTRRFHDAYTSQA